MLLIIAGLLEFVLGNNFPFLVFMGYGNKSLYLQHKVCKLGS